MKIVKRVCDLCEKYPPYVKVAYKYKAKRKWTSIPYGTSGWDRIELCENCLEAIIKSKESSDADCN